jgi:hypothetical protein
MVLFCYFSRNKRFILALQEKSGLFIYRSEAAAPPGRWQIEPEA